MNLPNFKNFNLKHKLLSTAAAFIIIAILIGYLIILPTSKKIKTLRNEIITQKIDQEKKMIADSDMAKLNSEFNKIEPKLELFNGIFIDENKIMDFISPLEKIAANNSVEQNLNIIPSTTEKPSKSDKDSKNSIPVAAAYRTAPISIEVQGNFVNIMHYLIDLEALKYYISIKSLGLSKAERPSSGSGLSVAGSEIPANNVNLKITADTYWK